ncbi:four helix bundle protein [Riemerella anatipestifer]|uniref:four helix bundle protein n=1 Tax=Riemerella anatipestifer TaxID=34085 RepID=UPI0001F0E153|nr:four helix bundle protein [Riemerella anatipestifer]ADZ12581.1 S23 ribosomal protein [Riemerella anatipestifer RA-GD]AGC40170.1 hypothetical protein G148_0866 [Riemerella anatipestifer RA-CH-2]AKP69151.1 S23 ribosomal protein [Riemerella anatipestifer]AKP71030.1 S23 ribosomal protein [Riemerella anatipestifer]AKQ39509.1 30S ribosomal protein S23 [Riemerella anatipestifer Yb2]
MFYFEKLEVWQNARKFTVNIYRVTERFPNEEKFGIVSQMRRASMSICANISEGISRKTNKDKSRFLNLSYGSAIEVLNFLIIANDLEYIEQEEYLKLRKEIELITNQLNGLYNKLKND